MSPSSSGSGNAGSSTKPVANVPAMDPAVAAADVARASSHRPEALGVRLDQVRHHGAQAEHGGREQHDGTQDRPGDEAQDVARHPGEAAAHHRERPREAGDREHRPERHGSRVGEAAPEVAAHGERREDHPDDGGPRNRREPEDRRDEARARDLDREDREARREREREEARPAAGATLGDFRGPVRGFGHGGKMTCYAARRNDPSSSASVERPLSRAYHRRTTL